MRTWVVFVSASFLAIALAGCGGTAPAGDQAMEKRMAELETELDAMKNRDRDVRAKLRAAHTFGRTPLEDFFASPEFWECTYDSSWSDCSSRCSKQTAEGYKACLEKPEGPERVQCVEENSARGAACLKGCPVQTSPTDPPGC